MFITLWLVSQASWVLGLSPVTPHGVRKVQGAAWAWGPVASVVPGKVIVSSLPNTEVTLKPQKSGCPPAPKDPAAQPLPPNPYPPGCFLEGGAVRELLSLHKDLLRNYCLSYTPIVDGQEAPGKCSQTEVSNLYPKWPCWIYSLGSWSCMTVNEECVWWWGLLWQLGALFIFQHGNSFSEWFLGRPLRVLFLPFTLAPHIGDQDCREKGSCLASGCLLELVAKQVPCTVMKCWLTWPFSLTH